MAALLSDKEKRLQLRRFAREEWSRDNTVEPLAILHKAKVDIPLVLSGRSRDSNIKLIKGELGRVGQLFREKFSRNRKGKMTPELRAQIEGSFAENPYGVSYQSVVTGLNQFTPSVPSKFGLDWVVHYKNSLTWESLSTKSE